MFLPLNIPRIDSKVKMFRDRTNLFLSYRRTTIRSEKPSQRFDQLGAEEEGLIGSRRNVGKYRDTQNSIEMQPIIPTLYDIAKDIDENLTVIKREINELNSLYKKLIIVSQSEKRATETKIENINYTILKDFEKCYIAIKKFEYLNQNHGKLGLNYTEADLEILSNYKKNYAKKIQDNSLIFRNLQNNYIKFLRDDEDETDTLLNSVNSDNDTLLMEEESSAIENYSKQILQQQNNPNLQYIQERDREISKIAMGILEISTIFKEMESMIVDQGSILDRIDYNLQNTAHDLKSSDKELIKAKSYQQRTTKCKIIFLLSLIVFVLLIIVFVKPHNSTKVVERPSPDVQAPPKVNNDVETNKGEINGEENGALEVTNPLNI